MTIDSLTPCAEEESHISLAWPSHDCTYCNGFTDAHNSKWKSTAKVGKNSFTIIINEMIDLFGVKTNDFRPSCNSYLSV